MSFVRGGLNISTSVHYSAFLLLIDYSFRKSRVIQTALEQRGRFHSGEAASSLSKAVREVSQNPKRRAKNSLAVEVRSTTRSVPLFVARSRSCSVKREPIPQP